MHLGFRKGAASIDKAVDAVGALGEKWWWTNLIVVSMPSNCFLFLCAHMSPPEHTRVLPAVPLAPHEPSRQTRALAL